MQKINRLFYNAGTLSTVCLPAFTYRILRSGHVPFCQSTYRCSDTESTLLATDAAGSVQTTNDHRFDNNYTCYGYTAPLPEPSLAFNGQLLDPFTGSYALGGIRHYLPHLLRFASADPLSPFAEGGINCYVYCGDDPVNYSDPSGLNRLRTLLNKLPSFLRPKNQAKQIGTRIMRDRQRGLEIYDDLPPELRNIIDNHDSASETRRYFKSLLDIDIPIRQNLPNTNSFIIVNSANKARALATRIMQRTTPTPIHIPERQFTETQHRALLDLERSQMYYLSRVRRRDNTLLTSALQKIAREVRDAYKADISRGYYPGPLPKIYRDRGFSRP